ncbi:MAG: hypothetical protein J0I12_34885 [Candidatus Eremiobacteraeota bacterium]|nr:hypothetical protein [Candidatus Eremiobacteraeota bacterium]
MDYWYRLDSQDRISAVSENFDQFSRDNGGPEQLSREVLGRPLWDFVEGEDLRVFLKSILERAQQGTVRIPMRCDSPGQLRLLEMQVTPDRQIHFLELKLRDRPEAPAEDRLVTMCSWCNTMETEVGWLPLDLMAHFSVPSEKITHGICPQCEVAFENGEFDHLESGF